MKADIMIHRTPVLSTEYKKYEVSSKQCSLRVCDSVTPQTIIGRHHQSGQAVKAGLHGQVATIYYNPMHDSLMITVTNTMLEPGGDTSLGNRIQQGDVANSNLCHSAVHSG